MRVKDKTIIFHSLDHARAALDAARACGAEITLQTAPGAAVYGGVGYLKAIVEQAGVEQAGALEAVIDCGEDAGVALAALRTGWKLVMFSGRLDVFAKVADIAEQQGARVMQPEPDSAALDLLDTPDPADACRKYLSRNQK